MVQNIFIFQNYKKSIKKAIKNEMIYKLSRRRCDEIPLGI